MIALSSCHNHHTPLQGDSARPDVATLIPDRTTGYLVHTFGALFADIAHQVRRNSENERAALLHRLNDLADAYGHVRLPDDEEGAGPTDITPAPPAGGGQ